MSQSAEYETDYLVVGAGAVAMSFIDTMLDESNADIIVVDRRDKAGGHWNDAYPFVRLHQPSAWYGVPSRPLPADDEHADGRGARGSTVHAYFDSLMRERFIHSGRVRFLPRHEYHGSTARGHRIFSTDTGKDVHVRARRIVDATLTQTQIPSKHKRGFNVAANAAVVSPNELPTHLDGRSRYTVLGGGKTAMDSCLWLMERGVAPTKIRWIIPRDSWLVNRSHMRPGNDYAADSLRGFAAYYDTLATAQSLDEIFCALEERNVLLRLDRNVKPLRVRGAVSSTFEMKQLQQVEQVVRLGHVVCITDSHVVLQNGMVETLPRELFVDCTASAAVTPSDVPVFEKDTIRMLMLAWGQPLLSASLIAHIELMDLDEAPKNALSTPVVSPIRVTDWIPMWKATLTNSSRWRENGDIQSWIRRCRLHVPSMLMQGVLPQNEDAVVAMKALGASVGAAVQRLSSNPLYR